MPYRYQRTLCLIALPCSLLALCAGTRALADDPPVRTVNGQPISAKDLDATVDNDYRRLALRGLIRRDLVDQAAKAAGVEIADAQVDSTIGRWKLMEYNGDEAAFEQGLARVNSTPAIYRESVREGLLAGAIIDKTVQLQDPDYMAMDVRRFHVATRDQADTVSRVLMRGTDQFGHGLGDLQREFNIEISQIRLFRYDERLDYTVPPAIFTAQLGEVIRTQISHVPEGYQVFQVIKVIRPESLMAPDRAIVAGNLLAQKKRWKLQEWWDKIDAQVQQILGTPPGSPSTMAAGNGAPVGAPSGSHPPG